MYSVMKDTAFQEYVGLTMLVYTQGGLEALNWLMQMAGQGPYEERLQRARWAWVNFRTAMWGVNPDE